MNCHMQNITMTGRDGKVAKLEYVYIRGSKIRFLIVPDMLKVFCPHIIITLNVFSLNRSTLLFPVYNYVDFLSEFPNV